MRVSIFVPSVGRIAGGPLVMYEHANHLARRGHEVHLAHMLIYSPSPRQPLIENVSWFDFEDGIIHHCRSYPDVPVSAAEIGFEPWGSDVMIGQTDLFPGRGLPSFFLQGRFATGGFEQLRTVDGPIACVSNHLVDVCLDQGVDPHRVFHVPNAVDHSIMRLGWGADRRGRSIAFQVHPFPMKGTPMALRAIGAAREKVPDLTAIAFGERPATPLPDWIEFVESPDQHALASEVFGRARAFLCTSEFEGFGLTSVEAMACGAALVTVDTKGSRDFAVDRRTALVSPVEDLESLVDNIVAVLTDDELHRDISEAGTTRVADLTWDRSGSLLEEMLLSYVANPVEYRLSSGPANEERPAW